MLRNPTLTVLLVAAVLALCRLPAVSFIATPRNYRKLTTALHVSVKGDLEKAFGATVIATSCLVLAVENAFAAPTPSSLLEGSSQIVSPVEIISPFGGGFGGFGLSPFGVSPLGGFGFGFGIRATAPAPKADMDVERSKAELEALKEKQAQLEKHIQALDKEEEHQTAPKAK